MKISKVIGLVSCLVSCLVSGLAVGAMSPSSVNTGLYLRGSLGVGGMISPDVAEVLPVFTPDMGLRHDNSMSRGGVVYAATLGYLHSCFTDLSMGAEVGYLHLNDNHYDAAYLGEDLSGAISLRYQGNPINLLAVMRYTFNHLLSVSLRGGMLYQQQNIDISRVVNGSHQNYHQQNSRVLPALGAGLGYHMGSHWMVSANYLHGFGQTPAYNWTDESLSASQIADANRVVSIDIADLSLTYIF